MHPKLSYANVISSVALFVALGGTAIAAVTLPRDSVGSVQISQDGVRSPEIRSGAVRSSEILDAGIRFGDIAPEARPDLLAQMRVAEDDSLFTPVPECNGTDLSVCPNRLTLPLTPGAASRTPGQPVGEAAQTPGPVVREAGRNWLVQAKFKVRNEKGRSFFGNRCGLVNTATNGPVAVLDEVQLSEGARLSNDDGGVFSEVINLSATVRKKAGNPTVALRCSSQNVLDEPDEVSLSSVKLTALEVGNVTGP